MSTNGEEAFQVRFDVIMLSFYLLLVKETNYLYILHDTLCLATSSVQQSQPEACQGGNYGYYIKLLDTVPARCPFDKTLPYLAITCI